MFLHLPALAYHDPQLVARVNANASAGWTAGRNEFFAGRSFDAVRSMMGSTHLSEPEPPEDVRRHPIDGDITLPASFDARKRWPECPLIGAIHDQGECGSCWAFGSTTAFNDRLCIANPALANVTLSVEATVACDTHRSNGCLGGSGSGAWDYFHAEGLPTWQCMAYKPKHCQPGYGHNPCWGPPLPGSNSSHPTPRCTRTCDDGSAPKRLFKAASAHYSPGPTDEDIMKDIFSYGSVSAGMEVYDDFLHYKSGVYSKMPVTKRMGGHVVRLLGWGEDQGTPYWLVANEWSTTWGEGGFFRIHRGKNGAGFPGGPAAGTVDKMAEPIEA